MELKLEVLSATGLSDAEYRFGDVTKGFLGAKGLNPYIVVKLNQQSQQSKPVSATLSRQGASAVFNWRTLFEVSGGHEQLTFQVFDKKTWQAILRGDPLIGEAKLAVPEMISGDFAEAVVNLKSGSNSAGQIKVQYGFVQSAASDSTAQWLQDQSVPRSPELSTCSVTSSPNCPVISLNAQTTPRNPSGGYPSEVLRGVCSPSTGDMMDSWTILNTDGEMLNTDPAPALERTDSWESFKSADEGTAVDVAAQQCESLAKKYMEARLSNDLVTLKAVLSKSAVIQVDNPWGGSASYRGWDQIQMYFNMNKAEPGKNFKHWRQIETETSSNGSYPTTIVRWVGQVYKMGWWSVQSSMTIDSQNEIIQIHLVAK